MSFGERLKKLREERKITQFELAKMLNKSRSTIAGYEINDRQPDLDTLKKVADYFDVSVDYLLCRNKNSCKLVKRNDDEVAEVVKIPMFSLAGDIDILNTDNIKKYLPMSSEFIDENKEYFYVLASSDSMNLYFEEDSLVLVQKQDYIEDNEIAVLLLDTQEVTIKKVVKNNNIITLIPCSTNSIYQPKMYDLKKDNIKILGKVVLAIKKY